MSNVTFRFQVPKHEISLDTFVASAEATKATIRAISQEFFDDSTLLELYVLSPEAGCLRQILRVGINTAKGIGFSYAIIWAALQALETDIAKEVTKELTGKYPKEIAAQTVRAWSNALEAAKVQEISDEELEVVCQELSERVSRLTSEILSAPREKIEQLSLSNEARYNLADAQAKLFNACIHEESLESIEIETSNTPPIPRNQFPQRAISPKRREDDEIQDWEVILGEIIITSPNLEESDQKSRKWKGKLPSGKIINFIISDENFWAQVDSGSFRFGKGDKINAQISISEKYFNKKRVIKVIKVLSFNEENLGEPLDKNALLTILGRINILKKEPNLLDLLEDD
ncbi:triphosphoribosyl-dephospho-CoA synthase [Roseinatronobacter sp. S2]|uniref:triphosphoribosyl-dephospho-CoA synthase n=1 Tax=Roseinatronobacter sp. S2 TaxID=3035471 RepID=UPI00240F68D3|nr:triphosphoribosyl-dephospho-CoA synthase [Roseinatronobacter sp. S2]WFE73918.1 triphosphoribosyl-dephospho-CoA synthase [Roseinatronobacter sp. S2]